MKIFVTFLFSFLTTVASGNIHHIRFDQIPGGEVCLECYQFIEKNIEYYDHWSPEWNYDISKDSLISGLKSCYNRFSGLDQEHLEVNLLMGDVAHFLYNLEEEEFYTYATVHYLKALQVAPKDYRTWWYYGMFCANANQPEKSIEYFLFSEKLLPEEVPAIFWESFAYAAAIANMPSHCIFAMDKASEILGAPSRLEQQLGDVFHGRIVPMNIDSSYRYNDIWVGIAGDMITLISRPLGIKMDVDTNWNMQFYDYRNRQGVITMVPQALTNAKGKEITYTIGILFKVAEPWETLDGYLGQFVSKYPEKTRYHFSDKYPDMIAYQMKNKKMYKKIGGANNHMIGVARERPAYPGLLLEEPVALPQGDNAGMSFYRANSSQDRFGERIFYLFILDTCGDIYDEAFKVFKTLFEDQIIIE